MTSCLGSLKRPPFSWDLHTSWARGVTFRHNRPIKSRSVFTSRTPSVNETKQTIKLKSRPKYRPFDRFAQCDFFSPLPSVSLTVFSGSSTAKQSRYDLLFSQLWFTSDPPVSLDCRRPSLYLPRFFKKIE